MPRLVVYPAWRDNPYLNLLYLAVRGQGWQVDGTTELEDLLFEVSVLGRGDAVHLHWTQPVCQETPDAAEASDRLERLLAGLSAARGRGVVILWTVHNRLPHEMLHRELEVELMTRLAEIVTQVIQINGHTAEAVAEDYALPSDRLVTLPHSSYVGVYPADVSRAEARERLGVPASSPTVAFVGQIRPYKGIATLLDATRRLGEEVEDLTLLLAGATRPEVLADIEALLPSNVRVVRQHGFVDDSELQVWFRAADLLVFPYERVLNSGSVLLAATFGRPCVLPREPHLEHELGEHDWVSFFDPSGDKAEHLAQTMRRALRNAARDGQTAAEFARGYTPYAMSRDYARLLTRLAAPAAV
jgi:beta-1,4-mannosyltransferase